MKTTTTTKKATSPSSEVETTSRHESLRDSDGKLRQEAWTSYSVQWWDASGNRHILQPGQHLPLWVKGSSGWQRTVPCQIITMTAFVKGGRYLIDNGTTRLKEHPLTSDVASHPARGESAFLFGRAGRRKSVMGSTPVIMSNNADCYSYQNITVSDFNRLFEDQELQEGCPVQLSVRRDNIEDDMPDYYQKNKTWDVSRQQVGFTFDLPIPMVLSDEEAVLLHNRKKGWFTTVFGRAGFYDIFGITEVGISYNSFAAAPPTMEVRDNAPKQVWRGAITTQDVGIPTLDPDIVQRLVPFAGPSIIEELIPV
jgi:hypothetical protein